jgi:hypothetical protein
MSTFTQIFAATALVTLTTTSMAQPFGENTAEQKATQASETELSEIMALVNKNCGTTATHKIEWKAYAPTFTSFPEDKRDGRTLDNIYSIMGSQIVGHLRDIASYCKDEPIFKANVAKKLKSVVLTPSKEYEVSAKLPSHNFKLANGVLTITHHLSSSNTSSDTARKLF